MKFKIFLCVFFCSFFAFGQITISFGISQSEINTSSNTCTPFSAPIVNTSGVVEGIDSYGTFIFTRGGSGNSNTFELTRGLMLSTGNLEQYNEGIRQEGSTAWGGSDIFETAVGASTGSSVNATDLSFEFVALQEKIELSYVFGSNQYSISNSCINEGAAILWKPQGDPDTAFQNVALVNGNTVTIANINKSNVGACDDSNEAVLIGAQSTQNRVPSVTRYTQSLPAVLDNLTIGETYELRLIVADVDEFNDSVLFVEYPENNFTFEEVPTSSVGQITPAGVANDYSITVCESDITLGFNNPFSGGVSYLWTGPSGGITSSTTDSMVSVTESGMYTLTINPTSLPSCSIVKNFNVTLDDIITIAGVENIVGCKILADFPSSTPPANIPVSYDLTEREIQIFQIANNGPITQFVYKDSLDALIATPTNYTGIDGELINFEITFASGCSGSGSFLLEESVLPDINVDFDKNPNDPNQRLEVCDNEVPGAITGIVDGKYFSNADEITAHYFENTLTAGTDVSFLYFEDPSGTVPIDFLTFEFENTTQISMRYINNEGCLSTTPISLTLSVNSPPSGVRNELEPIRACGVEVNPDIYRATFDLTTRTPSADEPVQVTFHENVADADREDVFQPIPNPSTYMNMENPMNQQVVYARVVNTSAPGCPIVREILLFPDFLITDNEPFLNDLYLCEEQKNTSTLLPEADFLPILKSDVFDPIRINTLFNIRVLEGSPTGPEIIIPTTITTETYFASEDTSVFIEISSNQSPLSGVPYPVCTRVYELKLYVDPLGMINTPTSQVLVCGDDNGVFQGLVSEFNAILANEITMAANIELRYYATIAEAEADSNPITDASLTPANMTPITYYAKGFVTGLPSVNPRRTTQEICPTNIVPLIVNIEQEPELLPSPETTIFVCSSNASSLDTFRISDGINTIVNSSSGNITISYHPTLMDAENNVNPLIDDAGSPYDELTFAAVETDTVFYVRIEDTSTTGCFTVVEREVVFSIEPDTPNLVDNASDFVLCVSQGDPLTRIFDLSSKNAELIGNVTGRTIRYYNTASNAAMGTTAGEISQNGYAVTGTQTIWYRIENDNNIECNSIGELRLRVSNNPIVTQIDDIRQCSSNMPGFGSFNLKAIRDKYVNDTSLNVDQIDFYTREDDAGFVIVSGQEIPDPIPGSEIALSLDGNYINEAAFSQEILARITSDDGCVSFERFLLIVEDTPQIITEDINDCVNDLSFIGANDIRRVRSNFTFVNARTNNVLLRNSNEIEYFTDATRDASVQINNPNNYVITGASQIIYTRVYFASVDAGGESCFTDSQYNVNVNEIPKIENNTSFSRCENAPNSGTYVIDLLGISSMEKEKIYKGSDGNVEIRFFDTPAITSPLTTFTRTPSQNEVFAAAFVVRKGVDVCISNSFTRVSLEVIDLPELHTVGELILCDNDTNPIDGITNANLNQLKAQIINEPVADLGNYDIRFFEGSTELLGSTYTLNSGNLYRALINNNLEVSCNIFLDFTLRLLPGPIIGNTSIPALESCDVDNDGQEIFDLTLVENLPPFDNVVNYTFEYFTNSARTSVSQIASSDLNNYLITGVGRQEVFVKLTSTIDANCQFDTSFQLQLHRQPNLTTTAPISYCTNETLGEIRQQLVDAISRGLTFAEKSSLTFTLHFNPDGSDAPLLDTTVISASTIYVKATDTTRSVQCEAIQGVVVQGVLPPAIVPAFAPQECDVDGTNDGTIAISLSDYSEQIFAGTATEFLDHTVSYFNNVDDTPLVGIVIVDNTLSIRAEVTQKNTPNCISEVVFTIGIQAGPEVFAPASNLLTICNDSVVMDSTTLYGDVVALETAILGSQDPGTHEVLFFDTAALARDNNNAIDFNTTQVTTKSYAVKVRDVNTDCEALGAISITVSNLPEIASFTDNTYCENSTVGMNRERWDKQILATIPSVRQPNFLVSYHTNSTADSVSMLDDNDEIPNVNQITVRVTNINGCFSIATLPINEVGLPVINAITVAESSICDEDGVSDGVTTFGFPSLNSAFLGAQIPVSDFKFTYHTSMANADNAIEIRDASNITSGTYYVKLENLITGCSQIDSFEFTVNTIPNIDLSEISICQGEGNRIIDKKTNDPNDTIYLWEFTDTEGNITRTDIANSEMTITANDIGDIATLTVRNPSTGCENTAEFKIVEHITPSVEAKIVNDFGDGTAIIQVKEGVESDFTYELTGPVNVSEQSSNEFRNLLPGEYVAIIHELNGCGPISVPFIYIDYLPYFSPNDDGVSDTWKVEGLKEYPGAIVYIHDRFGKLLKTLVGDSSWDGTYEGTPMPTDDYWVLIEFTDRPSINDHIALKR